MKNEILRVFENKNLIIYKRIGRDSSGIPLYFQNNKNEKRDGCSGEEFRSISQVKKHIKNLSHNTY